MKAQDRVLTLLDFANVNFTALEIARITKVRGHRIYPMLRKLEADGKITRFVDDKGVARYYQYIQEYPR